MVFDSGFMTSLNREPADDEELALRLSFWLLPDIYESFSKAILSGEAELTHVQILDKVDPAISWCLKYLIWVRFVISFDFIRLCG